MMDVPMNLKTLGKKIRKLETRLQEGPQKLARLKRKLEALTKAKASKARKKAAARAATTRRMTKVSAPAPTKKSRSKAQPRTKATVALEGNPARKPKKKLNLSPERRAQLSAAMKARWDAKRAVAAGNPATSATGKAVSQENSQAP
jgi:hypothetical protein